MYIHFLSVIFLVDIVDFGSYTYSVSFGLSSWSISVVLFVIMQLVM